MPQTILIYGTPSLLTQKLHSILSRRHAVYSVQDEAALFAYSAQSSSGTVIFTDAICGELLSMRLITCGWKLVFLESVFDVRNSAITVGWHLYYDQLYGFSGYDPTTDIPVRAALDENPLPEVHYFMDTFLPAFSLTLDELQAEPETKTERKTLT